MIRQALTPTIFPHSFHRRFRPSTLSSAPSKETQEVHMESVHSEYHTLHLGLWLNIWPFNILFHILDGGQGTNEAESIFTICTEAWQQVYHADPHQKGSSLGCCLRALFIQSVQSRNNTASKSFIYVPREIRMS